MSLNVIITGNSYTATSDDRPAFKASGSSNDPANLANISEFAVTSSLDYLGVPADGIITVNGTRYTLREPYLSYYGLNEPLVLEPINDCTIAANLCNKQSKCYVGDEAANAPGGCSVEGKTAKIIINTSGGGYVYVGGQTPAQISKQIGSRVTFRAVANAGRVFQKWVTVSQKYGVREFTRNPETFSVEQDYTITAVFIASSSGGGGDTKECSKGLSYTTASIGFLGVGDCDTDYVEGLYPTPLAKACYCNSDAGLALRNEQAKLGEKEKATEFSLQKLLDMLPTLLFFSVIAMVIGAFRK